MTITVKHKFVSAIPDAGDTTIVQPSNWNDTHQLVGVGTMAEQDANNVAITGGSVSGVTVAGYVPTTRTITAGTGLSGGGDLSANRTVALANTAVTAGTYGNAARTITQTVDAQGRITNEFDQPIAITNTQVSGLGTASTKDAGVALGVATLDAGGTVPLSQIPASIIGGLNYQGTWNASTNLPTLTSSVGTKGYYYAVSVAGSTNLNGITDWQINDLAVFNGTVWQKIDNTDAVTSVNGLTGAVVLNAASVGAVSSVALSAPSFLSVSGSPVTSTGTLALTYSGTALPVANGGTGVTASSGANSVVLRDANQNVFANSFNGAGTVTVANSATPVTLTIASAEYQTINTGSGAQTFYLPNATTLTTGKTFYFNNNISSNTVNIYAADTTTLLVTIPIGGSIELICTSIATSNGTWDIHGYAPANTQWGSFTMSYPGTITGATWGGNTIGTSKGGTGLTTVGTAGQVLTSNGTTLSYTTPTTGTVTSVAATAGTGISVTGSPITTSGTLNITNTAPDQTVVMTSGTGISVTGTYPSFTVTNTSPSSGGTVTSVTGTAPVVSSGGNTPAISMAKATTSVDGYLSATDWTTFNNKQPSGTYVNSVSATSPITSSGGVTPTIAMPAATSSVNGYLTSTDWTTFNNKGSGTVTSVTGTAPVVSSGGTTPAISMAAATTSVNGYLTSTDWNTFNGKAPSVTYTTNYVPYGQGTTTPALSANFQYDPTLKNLIAPQIRASNGIIVNSKTVSANFTIASGDSAMSSGPITINSGITVTISSGSRWVVL